jgi:hypothetical protein
MNKYADSKGIVLEHYIISSGLKEIIEGSKIASKFKRIYASSYMYDPDGIAVWATQAINYTNKTQYIFRIAKGIFEEYDDRVNDSMPENQIYVPYENIVYVGDSATDIPCMRLVKTRADMQLVYLILKRIIEKKVYQLFNDGRINFYAPADYSARSSMSQYMKQIIDEITAREAIKTEQAVMNISASAYKMLTDTQKMIGLVPEKLPAREKKKLDEGLEELKGLIEGNID